MADLTPYQKKQPDQIVLAVYEAASRAAQAAPRRAYLGMSQIGGPCERALWLEYHGAPKTAPDGRIARVWANGHAVEARVIADLIQTGYKIDGEQLEFTDFGGRFRGHCDGVIHGVTKTTGPHILEIKSANDKAFKQFQAQGIGARPVYVAQVQCYLGYSGLTRALFVVENKNTQGLYTEQIHFQPEIFGRLRARAWRILESREAFPRPFEPESPECRWCDFQFSCGQDNPVPGPESPCRSCPHFRPAAESAGRLKTLLEAVWALAATAAPEAPSPQERQVILAPLAELRPDITFPFTWYHQVYPSWSAFWQDVTSRLYPLALVEDDGRVVGPEACSDDWCGHPRRRARLGASLPQTCDGDLPF